MWLLDSSWGSHAPACIQCPLWTSHHRLYWFTLQSSPLLFLLWSNHRKSFATRPFLLLRALGVNHLPPQPPPFNITSHARPAIYFQVAHSLSVYGKWLRWPFWPHRAHIMVPLLKTPLTTITFEGRTGLPAARRFNASQKHKRMCASVRDDGGR